ncbi:hypothetical protein SpCBS45565_g05098 [Spizellomyces sp. 'palustris']|nr:hypothetical protein SpCBS45565_g05098 [Spizellomyces sp. 'palustris']
MRLPRPILRLFQPRHTTISTNTDPDPQYSAPSSTKGKGKAPDNAPTSIPPPPSRAPPPPPPASIHVTDYQLEQACQRYRRWRLWLAVVMIVCAVDVIVLDVLWAKLRAADQ